MPAAAPSPAPAGSTPISSVRIENFRSIRDVTLELGRVTVLIGANGSGKSNLVEGIAVGAAAASYRLSHEFLAARGIRPTPTSGGSVRISLDEESYELEIDQRKGLRFPKMEAMLEDALTKWPKGTTRRHLERLLAGMNALSDWPPLYDFVVYSPDYPTLRIFADEGQILPIGVRGEGLFQHLTTLARERPDVLAEVNRRLQVLDWFDGFVVPEGLGPGEKRLAIRDRYAGADVLLDQRSVNEGFLFLLFAYVLMTSPETPPFFAIENVDTALNPKLCARLMADIVELARAHEKQVILTTHNPALLDGLDLTDDEQRLIVCERDLDGHTTVRRVPAPSRPMRLSEAFLRGYLGGLPNSF